MKYIIILMVVFLSFSCQEDKQKITAEEIIDKTIEKAGGERYRKATIEFKFRNHRYRSIRNRGEFQLERMTIDTSVVIKDVLSNTGFQRFINDSLAKVPDSMATRYSASVNSVHYFAHLPYALNDRAVNKQLEGETGFKGEQYYQIKITFEQEGGGADHHDEFMYWIHKDNFTIDYLAYKFLVNDGGIRFRAAFNIRTIEGIRFADYHNYTTLNFKTALKDLPDLYEQGKLELLSTIETEDINVTLNGRP